MLLINRRAPSSIVNVSMKMKVFHCWKISMRDTSSDSWYHGLIAWCWNRKHNNKFVYREAIRNVTICFALCGTHPGIRIRLHTPIFGIIIFWRLLRLLWYNNGCSRVQQRELILSCSCDVHRHEIKISNPELPFIIVLAHTHSRTLRSCFCQYTYFKTYYSHTLVYLH
jgi:hypothetical protein